MNWKNRSLLCRGMACAGAMLLAGAAQAQIAISTTTTPFTDISSTGTSIGAIGDDTETNILMSSITAAGFTGNALLGMTVANSAIRVGNNGAVLWGGDTSTSTTTGHSEVGYTNASLIGLAASNTTTTGNGGFAPSEPFICPFWDDLVPDAAGTIKWQVVSGNLIIQWTQEKQFSNSTAGNNGTFELIVYSTVDPNGPFCDFVYQDTFFASADSGNDGGSATIGYKNWGGPAFANDVQFSVNTQSVGGWASAGNAANPHALRVSIPVSPTNPSCTFSATPNTGPAGTTFLAKTTVTPGGTPTSTGLSVTLDASQVGAGTVTLFDDGPGGGHGDAVAGDNIFSNNVTVGVGAGTGVKTLTSTVMDDQGRSCTCGTAFSIPAPTNPTITLALSPGYGIVGTTFSATATVAPGANPVSSGTAVVLDGTGINAGMVTLYDDGTHGDAVAGNSVFTNNAITVGAGTANGDYILTATVTDAQGRSASAGADFSIPYCSASTAGLNCASTAYESISGVAIGSINDTVSCTAAVNGYENRTSVSSDIAQGQTLPMTVLINQFFSGDECYVFVDWNQDATFAVPAEQFILSSATSTMTGSITCPANAALGPTRMRVYLTFDTTPAPCLTGQTYGHIVDYTLNVIQPANPNITGNPASGNVGGNVLLTAAVVAGQNPMSTGLTVSGDLTSIGGSSAQAFYDDGTHGDAVSGDGTYSYLAAIPHDPAQSAGTFTVPVTVTDDQARSGLSSIAVTLGAEATGACCVSGSCSVMTAFNCVGAGGSYNGDASDCQGLNTPFASGDTFPIAILDLSTATTTITVPAGSGTVNGDLVVAIGLHHTYVGDVHLTLDNGTTTVVLANGDGFGDDLSGVYKFYDSAATSWNTASNGATTPIPAGGYTPDNPMSAFNGSPLAGTWTLTVYDDAGGDTGTIDSFAIGQVNPNICAPSTGSCCTNNQCSITTQANCTGAWTAGGSCTGPSSCNSGHFCGSADFNCDGDLGTDQDIESFFACLAGNCPALPCISNADFNGDGDIGTDSDIEAFFRVLGGGNC